MDNIENIDDLEQRFTEILQKTASSCLRRKHNFSKKKNNASKNKCNWFDKELKTLRSELRQKGRQIRQNLCPSQSDLHQLNILSKNIKKPARLNKELLESKCWQRLKIYIAKTKRRR